ncbi:MAG: molybdenum cofactor guanylyltransferase [Pseudomonadota bacterium]
MRVLGAILAGGASMRFGSDKAHARLGSTTLLERTMTAITPQTDGLVVCGREWPAITTLADRPRPGMGPLAGLNAALDHARLEGFDAVLCVPIDVHPLPENLRQLLQGDDARVLANQHIIGFWPVGLAEQLAEHLEGGEYSLRSWIAASGAIPMNDAELGLINVNRVDDLSGLAARAGNAS